MKIRKIVIIGLLVVGLCAWFVFTKDNRKESSEYKSLVRFANRQEVEIAVIRQSAILQKLKDSIRKSADPNGR